MSQLRSHLFSILFCLSVFVFSRTVSAQKPIISSFSPTKGNIGSLVIISGNNFSTIPSDNIVYFGDVKASVANATTTSLSVIVPAGASYKPISVTTNSLTAYSSTSFTVSFAGDGTPFTNQSFSPKTDSSWGFNVNHIAATDLDGDGDVDPVLVNAASDYISILRNSSNVGSISLQYSPSLKYTTGDSCVFVSFGDVDGDGLQDIVVVNSKGNSISVFKNNSTIDSIRLLPKIELATGSLPANSFIRDVDSDGKPDIICTNSGSNTISVFRNTSTTGVISFTSKIDIVTGKKPVGLAVADLDGDNLPDLAVANVDDFSVSLFKNSSTAGTISFTNKTDIANLNTSMLTTADLDNDGKTDLVTTTNFSSYINVLRNKSTIGGFSFDPVQQVRTGFGTPGFITAGDIDGDGGIDLAVNHINYSTVSILKNLSVPGTVSFSGNVDFPLSQMPNSILLTDLDNDARPDIISSGGLGSSALSILRNLVPKPFISSVSPATGGNGSMITITGNNFLTTSQVSFGGTPASSFLIQSATTLMAVVDTGSTGEIAVSTSYGVARFQGFNFSRIPTITSFTPTKGGTGTVVMINGTNFNNVTSVNFGNVPAASFTIVSPTTISATTGTLAAGNFDVSVTNVSGTATLGNFYTGVTIDSFYPTTGPVGTVVTVNGTHFSPTLSDNIVYFGPVRATVLSATTTSLKVSVPPGTSYQPITITVNNLTAYSLQPFIVTFKSTGNEFTTSSFGGRVDSAADKFPIYVSIADLNNDSKPDVVTSNFASGSISVSKNTSSNGDISFQYKKDYTTTKALVWSSSTGDLDGDGKMDVIAVTGDNGVSLDRSFSVFKNVSFADSIILARTEYPIGVMNSNPRYSAITDLDGDGKPDAIFLSFSGMAILRSTTIGGTISFAPKVDLLFSPSMEVPPAIADVDGDGKPDIIASGYSDNVAVFRNTSKPGKISFAQKTDIPTGFGPSSISLADLDNDGRADMIIINRGNNSFSTYKNKSTAGVIAFDNRINYQQSVKPDNFNIGDLDGDGRVDIAFSTNGDKFIYVIKNTSSGGAISLGTAVQYQDPYAPGHVFISDMNNDGKADLIANNASDGNNFSVLINMCEDDGLVSASITALGPTEICQGSSVILKTNSVNNSSYQWYKDGAILTSATDSIFTADLGGIYSVKITSNGIVASSAPVSVSVKSIPLAPVLNVAGTTTICKGTSTDLHSSTQVGIEWYKDNALLNGITDSVYRVSTAGKYKVIANSNGCYSAPSNEITITTNSVPSPTVTASASTFCEGDSAILTAAIGNGSTFQWNINEEQLPGAVFSTFTVKKAGNFSLTQSNNGCSATSKTVAISTVPSPLKPSIGLVGTSLKSSTQNGNQWYRDGIAINGATSQTYTPTNSGNYTVQVTQNNCKSAVSEPYSFIVTGVVIIDNGHFIKLSPNPVVDEMRLEFTLNGIHHLNVDLYDLNGKIIKRWKDQTNGSSLYLSECARSIYFARVYSTNGKTAATLKLAKQ